MSFKKKYYFNVNIFALYVCIFILETEVRVTLGSKPACTSAEQGQLWFDTLKRGLFLCDGAYWHSMLQGRKLKIILFKKNFIINILGFKQNV